MAGAGNLQPFAEIVQSIVRNAGKVAFSDFEAQPFAEIARSIVRNAGKVAFADFELQPSTEIARVHRAKCW